MNFIERSFLSISNLIFAGYTGRKNQVHQTRFFEFDISKVNWRSIGPEIVFGEIFRKNLFKKIYCIL